MHTRTISAVLGSALFCLSPLLGQTPAQYDVYGQGCPGSGTGAATCGSLNPAAGASTQGTLPNEYAFGLQTTTPLTVVGFRLFTKTFGTADVTIGTALYLPAALAPTKPDVIPAAKGKMLVSQQQKFYETFLDTPVQIPANGTFWIGQLEATLVRASGISTGTAPAIPTYYRRPAGLPTSNWTSSVIIRYPSFHILCLGGGSPGAVPILMHSGLPRIGQGFSIDLHHGRASSPAWLLVGLSDQNWSGITLPLDMGILGAPGCSILAAGTVMIGSSTNASGSLSQQFTLPNNSQLLGAKFFNQFYLLDPGNNPLQIAVTNGGAGTIGS